MTNDSSKSTPVGPSFARQDRSPWFGSDSACIVLIAIVVLAARAIVFANPVVGFDEQFYLLVGDRMVHGALPFVDIFDRKPVGIFLIYAASRLLGGEGFVEYKLVAALFVFATALLIYRGSLRRSGGRAGAVLAALLYVLWLDFMEGEAGQTPVFYNGFVVGAALLLLGAARAPTQFRRRGGAAMLLIGIALQIKYTVLYEGVYFGCAFLAVGRRQGLKWPATFAFGAMMVALALLPTALAAAYYWSVGHLDIFVFCNFVSILGQDKGPFLKQVGYLVITVEILLPLILFWFAARRRAPARIVGPEDVALVGWLIAAVVGVLVYWRFNSPHYALPIVAPLCILLAPRLQARRSWGIMLAIVAFVAGQIVIVVNTRLKGGNVEARALAAAAQPRAGCLFVYNGFPALYMLTHSCLPSRWAFPGHVNAADEANARALGADPAAITRAILASRPDTIVDTYPIFPYGNTVDYRLVHAAIDARYVLQACVVTPGGRTRVVYRLKDQPGPPRQVSTCPAAVLAQR